ncbi:unnamed protein product [Polarella glacialis]|uniref:Redoxin domain-containing protein n=1 Tax=Polarella glacialis TaxID=89957 RepID=A0A813LAC4_POLGL|nr:unnamed protein product [Polarella glacialis]
MVALSLVSVLILLCCHVLFTSLGILAPAAIFNTFCVVERSSFWPLAMARKASAASLAAVAVFGLAEAFVVPGSAPAVAETSVNLRASAAPQTGASSSSPSAGIAGVACLATVAAAAGLRAGRRTSGKDRKANSVVQLRAKVGDKVPNVGLDKGFPPEKVMLADFCKGKKVVLVGLPGAFTPT